MNGTGPHIYSEFSPHGMLISGGEVTVAKLFVGNTSHTVPYMLKHSDLFDELPEAYHDSAYLDRLHHYIPGWEVDTIRGEMFSDGYGFVVDYIAKVLKSMRSLDFSDRYQGHFTLSSGISTRDRDGIHKTFSGLMKILYPHGEATPLVEPAPPAGPAPLRVGHVEFQENQRGVSFDTLNIPHLRGASHITIVDPYIRVFHQARNLMELVEAIARDKDPSNEVTIALTTSESTDGPEKMQAQQELLPRVKDGAPRRASRSTPPSTTRSMTVPSPPTPAGASASTEGSTSSNMSRTSRLTWPASCRSSAKSGRSA